MVMQLTNLLGLLLGEMVTNLLIMPGDCCIGGVRHILSSFSVVGVISSPTNILSKLPSSTPLPNHLPQGNLPTSTLRSCFHPPKKRSKIILNRFSAEDGLLVSVPCDLVADHNELHKPFRVESCVIVTHLHRGELSQVLALRNHKPIVTFKMQIRMTFKVMFFCKDFFFLFFSKFIQNTKNRTGREENQSD